MRCLLQRINVLAATCDRERLCQIFVAEPPHERGSLELAVWLHRGGNAGSFIGGIEGRNLGREVLANLAPQNALSIAGTGEVRGALLRSLCEQLIEARPGAQMLHRPRQTSSALVSSVRAR